MVLSVRVSQAKYLLVGIAVLGFIPFLYMSLHSTSLIGQQARGVSEVDLMKVNVKTSPFQVS